MRMLHKINHLQSTLTLFYLILVVSSVRPDVSVESTPMFLSSINWPKEYPVLTTQEITVQAGESNLVKLTFIELDIESTTKCYDPIEIYDGKSFEFEQLGLRTALLPYDGKVLFSQVSICPHIGVVPHLHPIIPPLVPYPFGGGTPVIGPRSLMGGTPVPDGASPGQEWGTPWPGMGYPHGQEWGTPQPGCGTLPL